MQELQKKNKILIVIDHHISSKEIVESLPGHVFALEKSGAKLAWEYFHPNVEAPELIDYISDGDIWPHMLPDWKEVESYIHTHELTFKDFESLEKSLATDKKEVVRIGGIVSKQFDKHVNEHID